MKYQEFRERNPDFQGRVEALTSGILTPDTKGIALWSTKPGGYDYKDVYKWAKELCGVNNFPIRINSVWQYFNGSPYRGYEGSLFSIGAVVKMDIERQPHGLWVARYQTTDVGEELGKPLVARATAFVNMLEESRQRTGNPNYCSMWKIFGTARKSKKSARRRGYTSYLILKTLLSAPNREFIKEEIADQTGLSSEILRDPLMDLGSSGLILYESAYRESKGIKARIEYRVNKNRNFQELDPEEVYEQIQDKELKQRKRHLISLIDLIKRDTTRSYTAEFVFDNLKINIQRAHRLLSCLRKLEYLESDFVGAERLSRVKANDFTRLLWVMIFEPIEAIVHDLDIGTYPEFDKFLREYQTSSDKRFYDLQTQLDVFERERTIVGYQGGEEIRNYILRSLREEAKKPSHILETVNEMLKKGSKRNVSEGSIRRQLKTLIEWNVIEVTSEGKYRLKQPQLVS